MGAFYLRYITDRLSGQAILATAGYNAGPGRAKAWQEDRQLDPVIYIETIPFDETRDYVKKGDDQRPVLRRHLWHIHVLPSTFAAGAVKERRTASQPRCASRR